MNSIAAKMPTWAAKNKAPFCIGSPTACTPGQEECGECKFIKQCVVFSKKVLEEIESNLDIKHADALRKKLDCTVRKPKKPAEPKAPAKRGVEVEEIEGLNKRACHLVAMIKKRGLDLHKEIMAGRNPYKDQKPAYMELVCDFVGAGPFNRADLKSHLLKSTDMNERTACTHLSIIIPVLLHLNVVEDKDGIYYLESRR
jgi:hypothetical protein